jgi:very-short-patch-repair endonuclease
VPRRSEHAFCDKPGLRPAIWRIFEARDADAGKSERPARICRTLQVEPGAGEPGLARVADAQRGLVHRSQLAGLGIGRGAIAHRVKVGRLHRELPNVFGVGHGALEPLAREMAALLYVGDDCALSHTAAAALWGVAQRYSDQIDVTVVGRHVREFPGLRVHRITELDVRDVRLHDRLPVTAPARTLIDFAGSSGAGALERALAEARVRKLITDTELTAAMARAPGRAGVALVRDLLRREAGPGMTRSEAERQLLVLVTAAGLPAPETNVRVHGYEVDFLWRAQRLVVEVDGHAFHGHRAAFERDRAKGQHLTAAGYRVIRVTWRQLEREPLVVLTRIAQALNPQEPVP